MAKITQKQYEKAKKIIQLYELQQASLLPIITIDDLYTLSETSLFCEEITIYNAPELFLDELHRKLNELQGYSWANIDNFGYLHIQFRVSISNEMLEIILSKINDTINFFKNN